MADLEISCPVCSEPCLDPPLYRYSISQAAAHFCPPRRDPDRNRRLEACIRRLWQRDDSIILRCRKCRFGFGHPFIGGDDEFYHILHEQRGYPGWRWDYEVALKEAISKLRAGRVLDVGAGNGQFLRHLNNGWERYGIERGEANRKDLKDRRIRVFKDLPEAVQSATGTFQAVTLFQVLEHVAEFRTILDQCRQLLRKGGLLVITVPDCDAMIRQARMTGCPDMPPNHINKWTPQSLSLVLEECGFIVKSIFSEPASWRKVRGNIYLKITAEASQPRSLAAQIYRLPRRWLRIPLLALLAPFILLKLCPYISELRLGGAFAVIGEAK